MKKVYEQVNLIRQEAPLFLVYLLVVRVFAEEVFFRGFLVKRIGALGSSFAFGLAHIFYGSATEIAGAIILGFVLAKSFEANKNLLPNIFAHFLYNLIIVFILLQ